MFGVSVWKVWASTFGRGLRQTLLTYRDGARMVAGTRLTNNEYLKTTERIGNQMLAAGFSVRAAVVLYSTIYNYTISFVMEEQAVFPVPGERSSRYSLEGRNALLETSNRERDEREETIATQNEELQAKTEELERQGEELFRIQRRAL